MATLWKILEDTQTKVYILTDLSYDQGGNLAYGIFTCSGGVNQQCYIYQPGYTLPKDIANAHRGKLRLVLCEEDWN